MKQLALFKNDVAKEFGGSLLTGRRKVLRPLVFRQPIHFVLKAQNHWLLLKNRKQIEILLRQMSARFMVKVYDIAVNADHIHLVIQLHSRELYRKWIRGLTALLVRRITGLKFKLRPYSRVVSWGRQFESVLNYLKFNIQEAEFLLWTWRRARDLGWTCFGFPPLDDLDAEDASWNLDLKVGLISSRR